MTPNRRSVCLALIAAWWSAIAQADAFDADTFVSQLTELTNLDRARRGLPPVSTSERLAQAARLKARDMLTRGYFDHEAPGGRSPWSWLADVGYRYEVAAENLLKGSTNPSIVQRRWMASREHRRNILSPRVTEIGIAVVPTSATQCLVIAYFARPAA